MVERRMSVEDVSGNLKKTMPKLGKEGGGFFKKGNENGRRGIQRWAW
jgi:hypothetical protein